MQKALSLPRYHVVSDHPKYLSVGQVRIRYGWSNSTIARRLCSAGFPAPIRLGGKTAARRWSIADLEIMGSVEGRSKRRGSVVSNREQAKNKTKLARFDDVQFKAGALEQDGKKVAAQLQKVREYEAAAHEKAGHEFKKADEFWVSLPPLNAGFPAPIRLGGKTAARRWSIADLKSWEASKAEAKDEAPS